MNFKKNCLTSFAILVTSVTFGQANILIIPQNILLPNDTIAKTQLITSLNGFLSQINKPNNENTFVLKSALLETSALLDEMKNLSASKIERYKFSNSIVLYRRGG
jgi:hypothetical protein